MAGYYDDFKRCVVNSTTMDEVQDCIRTDNLQLP
jgi:hypothetical protein